MLNTVIQHVAAVSAREWCIIALSAYAAIISVVISTAGVEHGADEGRE